MKELAAETLYSAEMLYNQVGKLRDQLENGMVKSDMGNPGLIERTHDVKPGEEPKTTERDAAIKLAFPQPKLAPDTTPATHVLFLDLAEVEEMRQAELAVNQA